MRVLSAVHVAQNTNIPMMRLSTDAEKAFDRRMGHDRVLGEGYWNALPVICSRDCPPANRGTPFPVLARSKGENIGLSESPTLQDYYHVLGVERNATSGEIKNAFFALSKKCHPDSDPTNPLLHAQFVRLNEAYNVLSKSSSRRQYDQVLETIQRGRASADRSWKRTSPQGAGTTEGYRKEQHYTWYTPGEDSYYWSHFPPQSNYDEPSEKRQQRNRNIVWACVIGSFVSIYLHFCVFSTIRDIRNKEIEEQQRRIMDFYNMTRENARMNSFSKQQEILLQRHEDRLKKLYGREDDPKK
ncbi:dnaJ homolog subfamily C member 4 [Gastrophryne carolinensis]